MPKLATKVSSKVKNTDTKITKAKSDFKPYQIRINITRELYNEIQRAKAAEYKFLNDAEIIKIFLSKGAYKNSPAVEYDDSDIGIADLTKHNLMMFAKDEPEEDNLIDWSKVKPINWNN
jgi:hypothetical protein